MMKKMKKRIKNFMSDINCNATYNFLDAVKILQSVPKVKFIESVDISIKLGIDPKKSEQNIRGSTVLPYGSGKIIRVAVFTKGDNINIAKKEGADFVGMEDLAEICKKGSEKYDVIIASPEAMPLLGKLGPILGPKGLMPNPKMGTVTSDIGDAVKKAKSGQIFYRNDKYGILHCTIGRLNFKAEFLKKNMDFLIKDLKKMKPLSSKGKFFQKINISSTMGPGLKIDLKSIAY